MTEMKHTKEPWIQWQDHPDVFAGGVVSQTPYSITGGERVADFSHDDPSDEDATGIANAARCVSCINALAGIPNPPAFVEAVKELVDMLDSAIVYHSNGTVARVEYANGVVQALDNLRNHLPAEGDKR